MYLFFLSCVLKKVNNALNFGIPEIGYNKFDNILRALSIISVINFILRAFFSLFFINLKLSTGIISLFVKITDWFNKILRFLKIRFNFILRLGLLLSLLRLSLFNFL